MKKIIAALVVALLPLCVTPAYAQLFNKKNFQGKMEQQAYMQGAVPEKDGQVVFEKDFTVAGKSQADICKNIAQWANLRYMASTENGVWTDDNYYKNLEYARVTECNPDAGIITCQADEEMVFTNKTLAKDYTQLNYVLSIRVSGSNVHVEMGSIVYTYQLTEQPSRIPAEDWITDAEAISKKGVLYRKVAKFRIKTVDLANELFKELEEAAAR